MVLHLHHHGHTLLVPAPCSLSPSSSSATLPHPHRNVTIRCPACVHPSQPLTSIDRFALALHLHYHGVTSELGLEQNGLPHRSACHHMLLLTFVSLWLLSSFLLPRTNTICFLSPDTRTRLYGWARWFTRNMQMSHCHTHALQPDVDDTLPAMPTPGHGHAHGRHPHQHGLGCSTHPCVALQLLTCSSLLLLSSQHSSSFGLWCYLLCSSSKLYIK